MKARGRLLVEVLVDMPQQNIRAAARARERRTAEILACVEFKKQAEEWHAKNGQEDIIVKDATALNSRNARKFFEFYKIKNKGVDYNPRFQQARGSRRLTGSTTEGQMTLNGENLGEPVEMQGKKHAEAAAYLTGALELKRQNPELFEDFVEALKQGNGELLKPVPSSWVNIDQDCLLAMTDTILKCRKAGMEESIVPDETDETVRRMAPRRQLPAEFMARKNAELIEANAKYMADPKLAELRRKKFELPMNQYRDKVLQTVNQSAVSIIVGATGSGKTSKILIPSLAMNVC